MKRKKKSSWAWNFLLLIICAALTVALAGFIAWDSKTEAAKNEKLVQEEKKEEPQIPAGISFWGDEFFTAENELQYSSRVKLEEKLKAEGYTLEYANKTLAGAGTLSVMKMAGVPQTDLDKYIEKHKASAGGATPPVTETGIRDLTAEEMDRFDKVGVRPMDGSVNIPEYEKVMKETWGEHYISTIDICTVTTTTADGQTQVADALYNKLLELGYIVK